MLADTRDIASSGRIAKEIHLPSTAKIELVAFIAGELPGWRDCPGRPAVLGETSLTEHLCAYLNDAAYFSATWDHIQFQTETGDMRFFAEDVFVQMLPQPMGDVSDPPWDGNLGIGTGFHKNEGLGEGTFAHGAASGAFTRIDPQNDLVIIMTRNSTGKNHLKYSEGFFRTIVNGLEEAP